MSSPARSDFNPNRNSSYLAIIAGQGIDDSSTVSYDTATLQESPESDKEGTLEPGSEKPALKTKTHSRFVIKYWILIKANGFSFNAGIRVCRLP